MVEDDYRRFMDNVGHFEVQVQQREENEEENSQKQGLTLPQIASPRQDYRINDYAELDNITSNWT